MAQTDIPQRIRSLYIGAESTLGTTPSMTRDFSIDGDLAMELTQTETENDRVSTRLFDYLDPIRGLKTCSIKCGYRLSAPTDQLTSSATPGDHYQGIALKEALGGEQRGAGSTVAASPSPTTTVFAVGSGHGSRFAIGQLVLVETSSGLECRLITNIATDTLTVAPVLSAAPSAGNVVYNMYNYYPTELNSLSVTRQVAYATDSNEQYTLNGLITDSLEIQYDRDGFVTANFSYKGLGWTGPSSQSISTAIASDTMVAPIHCRDMITLVQPVSPGTSATQYPLKTASLKLSTGKIHVMQLGGTAEGMSSVFRESPRLFAELTLRFRKDRDWDNTYWASRTAMNVFLLAISGTGTSRRFVATCIPTCVVVGKPKLVLEGDLLCNEVVLRSKLNAQSASGTGDLQKSPFVLAVG